MKPSMSINYTSKRYISNYGEPFSDVYETNKDNNLILTSGSQLSSIVPLPLVPGIKGKSVTVSTITMSTADLKDSKIKLDFALNIDIPAGFSIPYITFQVFKQYYDSLQKLPVGASWTFYANAISGANTVFYFSVFDNDRCNSKHCTYILEATPYS